MPRYSWGLTIATKDRPEMLQTAIRLGLTQSRPPSEVVVVDASEHWERHSADMGALVEELRPGTRFVYLPADRPSVSGQRNQAIAASRADILFMIDDDSFMYPDCAARILEVYEASPEVLGVQAMLRPDMPDQAQASATMARKVVGAQDAAGRQEWAPAQWLRKHLLLMNRMALFLPYNGAWPELHLPAALKDMPVRPEHLFHGCRMTFRRDAILRVGFDPTLRHYCPGEDLDASHRIAQIGPIVTAETAYLHHYNAAQGRIDRQSSIKLAALNQAYLLSRHAANTHHARQQYFRLMWRRVLAEALKDGLSRRLSFPQLRGLLAAMFQARAIFDLDQAQMNDHYSQMQINLLQS